VPRQTGWHHPRTSSARLLQVSPSRTGGGGGHAGSRGQHAREHPRANRPVQPRRESRRLHRCRRRRRRDPATGQLAGADIQSQTRQILDSFQVMLESVGSDLQQSCRKPEGSGAREWGRKALGDRLLRHPPLGVSRSRLGTWRVGRTVGSRSREATPGTRRGRASRRPIDPRPSRPPQAPWQVALPPRWSLSGLREPPPGLHPVPLPSGFGTRG
jgi:hypothetical protein